LSTAGGTLEGHAEKGGIPAGRGKKIPALKPKRGRAQGNARGGNGQRPHLSRGRRSRGLAYSVQNHYLSLKFEKDALFGRTEREAATAEGRDGGEREVPVNLGRSHGGGRRPGMKDGLPISMVRNRPLRKVAKRNEG